MLRSGGSSIFADWYFGSFVHWNDKTEYEVKVSEIGKLDWFHDSPLFVPLIRMRIRKLKNIFQKVLHMCWMLNRTLSQSRAKYGKTCRFSHSVKSRLCFKSVWRSVQKKSNSSKDEMAEIWCEHVSSIFFFEYKGSSLS